MPDDITGSALFNPVTVLAKTDTGFMVIRTNDLGELVVAPARNALGYPAKLNLDASGNLKVVPAGSPLYMMTHRYRVSGTVSSTGQLDLYGETIPTGEVWQVFAIGAQYIGTSPATMVMGLHDGSYPLPLLRVSSPPSGSWNVWTGTVYARDGWKIHWRFANATAGDTYVVYYICNRLSL